MKAQTDVLALLREAEDWLDNAEHKAAIAWLAVIKAIREIERLRREGGDTPPEVRSELLGAAPDPDYVTPLMTPLMKRLQDANAANMDRLTDARRQIVDRDAEIASLAEHNDRLRDRNDYMLREIREIRDMLGARMSAVSVPVITAEEIKL